MSAKLDMILTEIYALPMQVNYEQTDINQKMYILTISTSNLTIAQNSLPKIFKFWQLQKLMPAIQYHYRNCVVLDSLKAVLRIANQQQLLMNLLPKNYSQFKQKIYWDSFFKNLKHQDSFQWYGSFQNYRENLFFVLAQLSQLNAKSKTFAMANVGCGNSTLAQDIVTAYPAFAIKVNSFDYSEQVIAEMQAKNQSKEKLTYEVCDVLQPIKEQLIGQYDIVIDKGTLDAILPEDKPEDIKEIEEIYFQNIKKMLKVETFSSYVVISMLQSFILETLLKSFFSDHHFTIRIHERFIPDSEVQPFLIEIRRSPIILQKSKIEIVLLNKSIITPIDIPSALAEVLQLQKFNSYTKNIKELRPNQIAKFNIFGTQGQTLRYMVEISDHYDANILKKNSCSVFIVPQGMENLPLFSTEHGIRELQNQINTSRLIVAKLVIGQKYKDIESIKNELNPIIPNIIQKNCVAKEVPYLTDGSIGERHYIFEDEELFIQQILIQNQAFRRLVLKNNLSLVQSQFKLDYVSEKNHPFLKDLQTKILPPKKGLAVGIDHQHLDEGYCRFIASAINKFNCKEWKQLRFLHLGGGACAIPQFLYHKIENSTHKVVEASKSVAINCSKYFEWPEKSNRFEVINAQALSFTDQLLSNKEQFEVIIVDISNDTTKDAHYPPLEFLSPEYLKKLKSLLAPSGLLLINTLSQSSEYEKILNATSQFSFVFKSLLKIENHIWVCVNRDYPKSMENGQQTILIEYNPLFEANGWQEDKQELLRLVLPVESAFKLVSDKKKKKKKK